MSWEPITTWDSDYGGPRVTDYKWVPPPNEPDSPKPEVPAIGGLDPTTPYSSTPKPDAPSPEASPGRKKALKNYTDWVAWKRTELQNLVKKYRAEFPKQIAAYQTSAWGALPKAKKEMWGGMYTNLDQRGLADSSSFRAGAQKDLATWMTGEKSKIADTAQGMEAAAQNTILTALGRPDYGALYQNWVSADDQQAAYDFRVWQKKYGGG